MNTTTRRTGKQDGDDDDDKKKKDSGQNPLQSANTGVESGTYKHPDYIPGETEAEDKSQL